MWKILNIKIVVEILLLLKTVTFIYFNLKLWIQVKIYENLWF